MTPGQLTVLKAAIAAETDPVFVDHRANGNNSGMSIWFAQPVNPAFYVWKSSVNTDDVFDAINWALLTPADVPSAADSVQLIETQINRGLVCQTKQINLQILLQGRQTINATKLRVRQALTDSLQNVPSGASGAAQDAGWAQVKATMYRPVNRGEKIFATGTGTTGVPGLAGWEGNVSRDDILAALAS